MAEPVRILTPVPDASVFDLELDLDALRKSGVEQVRDAAAHVRALDRTGRIHLLNLAESARDAFDDLIQSLKAHPGDIVAQYQPGSAWVDPDVLGLQRGLPTHVVLPEAGHVLVDSADARETMEGLLAWTRNRARVLYDPFDLVQLDWMLGLPAGAQHWVVVDFDQQARFEQVTSPEARSVLVAAFDAWAKAVSQVKDTGAVRFLSSKPIPGVDYTRVSV